MAERLTPEALLMLAPPDRFRLIADRFEEMGAVPPVHENAEELALMLVVLRATADAMEAALRRYAGGR